MKRIIFLVNLLMLTIFTLGQSSFDKSKLDHFIDSVMQDWKVPGIAIAIVKGDEVLYQKGYGFRNLELKESVTPNTLFSIASSTKSFTATAGAMLFEKRTMSFEKPLIEYFPDFKLYDKFATERITFLDLLTHRSGIPRQKFFSLNTPKTRYGVREAFQYFEPSKDFRTTFQYCNEGYTVAGDMMAELANTTWEEFIKTNILLPLEMENTIFSFHSLDESKDYALPYIDWNEGPELMDYHDADILGPAGCIISNVKDLSNWLIFNINNGVYKEKKIIGAQALSQIQSPRVIVSPRQPSQELTHESYGMGWFIDYYKGYKHINHGGVLYGFSSQISFLPSEKIGVVVLANLNGTIVTSIIERYIYDYMLGLEITDWNKRYLDQKNAYLAYVKSMQEKADTTKPLIPELKIPLNDLIGKYESRGYGSFDVYNRNDTLRTKLLEYECSFIPTGETTFSLYHPVEHSGWPVSIKLNSDGNTESLIIDVIPGLKGIIFRKIH